MINIRDAINVDGNQVAVYIRGKRLVGKAGRVEEDADDEYALELWSYLCAYSLKIKNIERIEVISL